MLPFVASALPSLAVGSLRFPWRFTVSGKQGVPKGNVFWIPWSKLGATRTFPSMCIRLTHTHIYIYIKNNIAVNLFLSMVVICSTPWRMCSRNSLNTFKRNPADTRWMWRRASTPKRLWRQSLVGASHVLSYFLVVSWKHMTMLFLDIYIRFKHLCKYKNMWG